MSKCPECNREGTVYKRFDGDGKNERYIHTGCCFCKKEWSEK